MGVPSSSALSCVTAPRHLRRSLRSTASRQFAARRQELLAVVPGAAAASAAAAAAAAAMEAPAHAQASAAAAGSEGAQSVAMRVALLMLAHPSDRARREVERVLGPVAEVLGELLFVVIGWVCEGTG